jgi:hypothetical protein
VRKPIGLFVAAFATVAGGGLAAAIEGGPPDEAPPPPASTEADQAVGHDDPGTPVEAADVEAVEVEVEAHLDGDHPENHGLDVSTAAHECLTGDVDPTHGECVSAFARDQDGDGVPDHGPGSLDFPGQGGGSED